MKVLVFGAWDDGDGYPRTPGILAALDEAGVELSLCRVESSHRGVARQRLLRRPWCWPAYWLEQRRLRRRARQQLAAELARSAPDLLLVPYPGHFAVHWARQLWSGPLVLDLFLSVYDTAVLDRRLCHPRSPLAAWLRRIDRRACATADLVLLDTPQNCAFAERELGVPGARLADVPVCFESFADGGGYRPPSGDGPVELLFFGTGVPLHGLSVLIEAVRRVPGMRLNLCGGSAEERRLARTLPEVQLRLLPEFLPRPALLDELRACHLVAGVFGAGDKTLRVLPFKVVMALAAGRPVVTAQTPAISTLLHPGQNCLVSPPGDVNQLAAVLQRVVDDPGQLAPLAQAGRLTHAAQYSPAAIAGPLLARFEQLLGSVPVAAPRIAAGAVPRPVSMGVRG